MLIVEQINDTHVRVFYDNRLIYDSYEPEAARYAAVSNILDGPRERGLQLKELAESHY